MDRMRNCCVLKLVVGKKNQGALKRYMFARLYNSWDSAHAKRS